MPRSAVPWVDLAADPDPRELRAVLQRGLHAAGRAGICIEDVRVSKVRRSSSVRRHPHPVTLCMELALRDTASGALSRLQLYGKAYRDGASARALAQVKRSALVAPAWGEAVSHLDELDMLVWAWPNDPSLPQLARLVDPLQIGAHLPGAGCDGGGGVECVEVLRYEPERRATLRCTLEPREGEVPRRVLYGKTFCDDHARVLLNRFELFWQLSQDDSDAPCVARPLGWDAATRTLWQEAAQGTPLLTVLASIDPAAALECVGRALARLHLTAAPTAAARSTSHWLAELRLRAQKISRALPQLRPRAEALAQQLEHAAERLPHARQTLIHGDFHPEQVWLDGARVVLFDFDEFAIGNPMEDMAEFIVKLAQVEQSPARLERQVAALIDAYRGLAPHCFDSAWLEWHRAMQTLLQASRAFIYQEPGWREQLELRLSACESIASALCSKVTA